MGNSSSSVCNDHGDLENTTCSCDWGWYGKNCDSNGVEKWDPSAWLFFRVIFSIFYIFLLVLSLYKLQQTLSQDKIVGIRRLFDRLFRSPKNLCLLYLILIGVLRTSWLLTDPLRLKEVMNRTEERLLYETVYPLIYGLYSSVLLVWGGLYQGMRAKRSDPFKILRKLIMAMMILAFPVSITISVLKGYRLSTVWYPAAIAFVVVGVFLMFVGFGIFGILLFIYVENTKIDDKEFENINCPSSKTLKNETIPLREQKSKKTLNLSFHDTKLSIKANKVNWEDQYSISLESVLHMEEKFEFEENSVPSCNKIKENSGEENTVISLITEHDRIVFRKLGKLLALSIFLGILVMVFFPVLSSGLKNAEAYQELILLFCVFSFELFSCFLIYLVFTTHIKVEDKNYLRFFTIISLQMNKKIPNIKYPSHFSKIVSRLHNFYGNS